MSTHYIEEAERLADEVAVMAKGKIIARGRPAELIAEHAGAPDRRGLRAAGAARRGARRRRGRRACAVRPAGPAIAIVGSERGRQRRHPRGRGHPRRLARGRLRAADRGGGGVSAEATGDAAAGTGGDRRRDEPRGRQLPHLLEGHDLLQRAGTDRLPARLRARARARPWSTKSTASPTSSSSAPAWSRPR